MNLISTKQASEKLGVSIRRVVALIKDGRIPTTKVGRIHLIKPKDLDAVAERKPGRKPKE
jgi:excisionase family DNA binding protein